MKNAYGKGMANSKNPTQESPVYQLSDQYIDQLAATDPGLATALGIARPAALTNPPSNSL
mgnify:CR=1 FL=1